jgi:hypothetical protein
VYRADSPHPIQTPLLFLSHLLFSYTPEEKAGLERSKWFQEKGNGYMREQSTMPQTLGYSLTDSPVGLLAWIYEKLVNWTDNYSWDDDEGNILISYVEGMIILDLTMMHFLSSLDLDFNILVLSRGPHCFVAYLL